MIKESQIVGMSRSHSFKDKKEAAQFLGSFFSSLKDRKAGWKVLYLLAHDPNQFVKSCAINAINSSFVYIPEKEDAWQYLLHAALEPSKIVRLDASVAIGKVFDILPNKEKAWMELLEIIKKSANTGNFYPAFTIHDCFDCLEDKEKFIDSLKQLVDTGDSIIRSISNNQIGRIFISKSVKLEGAEFNKTYLEGLKYLKKSFDEFDISPHKFCYLMHNIFSKIIEGELTDVSEINKGIKELKIISEESTEKKKIVEILDELHIILEESLDAQKKGEDISKFKEKLIPICTRLNMLIGTLNNEIIRQIAEKAKERVDFQYKCSIKALKNVNNLIESPDKLLSEPNLLVETIKLCCVIISEPICNSYKSKLTEIEKEIDLDKKQSQLLQFIKEIKPVLEHEKTLKEIIVLGQNEIKEEINKFTQKIDNYFISINKNGLRQEIVISTGVEMFGTGTQVVTTIPLNEIGYDEINEDLIKVKNNMRLSEIPKKLKDRIMECVPTISKN